MNATTQTLISRLDTIAYVPDCHMRCGQVKELLETLVRSGEEFVDPKFLVPAEEKYARRLIHADPAGRYSVLAMVWNIGQKTDLHDHAHHWCVECVYRGRIKVVSYSLVNSEEDEKQEFKRETEVFAGPGEAGALIPPFEYHTLENAMLDQATVTLHVYEGEMTWANVFLPEGDGYVRHRRELSYTP